MRFKDLLQRFGLGRPTHSVADVAAEVARALASDDAVFGDTVQPALKSLATLATAKSLEAIDGEMQASAFIAKLLSVTHNGFSEFAQALGQSALPRPAALWSSARMRDFQRALGSDVFRQHVANLCLEVSGLHGESLFVTRASLDAARLTTALAALYGKALSATFVDGELSLSVSELARRRVSDGGTLRACQP